MAARCISSNRNSRNSPALACVRFRISPPPQIPQRTMAEAIAHADTFDFFHIDLTMIPSLVSAGLLEPLDDYMAEVGYKIDMVGNSSHFMRYNGKTYGLPTDGNVFIQLLRKDLFDSPDE